MIKALFFDKHYARIFGNQLLLKNQIFGYKKIIVVRPNFFSTVKESNKHVYENEKIKMKDRKLDYTYINLFKAIGFEDNLIQNTISNPKLSKTLMDLCEKMKIKDCDKKKGKKNF